MKKRLLALSLIVLMLTGILAIPAAAEESEGTGETGIVTAENSDSGGDGGDSEGDGSDGSEGDGSDGSEGDGSDGSEGDGSDGSEGDGSDGSEGDGSDGSEGDGSDGSEGDGSDGSEGDGSDGSEGDGSDGSEGDGSGDTEGDSGTEEGDGTTGDADCTHAWVYVEIAPTCAEYGAKGYGCGYCGAVKEVVAVDKVAHTYDNSCDAECNVCKATRTIEHNFSSQWSKNSTKHWHACIVCGEKSDTGDHYPGPAATEEKAQYCLTCGLMMMPKKSHTHKYATEYTSDAKEHWYACSGCDERKDVKLHSYDNLCDPECNDCGYTSQTAHSYADNWKYDAAGHWMECILCGEKKTVEAHVPGPEATDAQPQLCSVCSYELAPPLVHTHASGEGWEADENSHWKLCECGERLEEAGHSWDAGTGQEDGIRYVCRICGEERMEEIVKEETGGFPWWILLAALGMVMVGAIIGLAAVLIGAKKKKGKFHR